jgi:penicillin-binding protein 1A
MPRRDRQRRRDRSKGGPVRIILLGLGVIASVAVIGALVGIGWIVSVANSAPDLSRLKPKDPGENSTIYAADGTRLGVVQADILRKPIPSSSIPAVMKQATVAIEDKRFYEHGGVDFEGIVRAAVKNLESDETVQGGSTLTMQLIKNLYTEDRTRQGIEGYKRKIREAKLAEDLENVHPGRTGKNWVLTKYLNTVPYGTVGGQEAVGVQAAARIFFNKRAHELTLPEAALLAGLPQAPTDYNPYLHLRKATQRRNEVLRQMLGSHDITAAQYQDALDTPVELHRSNYYRERRENYFFDYVRKELVRRYGRETVRQGGLKVYTTVDLRLQRLARAAIASNLNQPNSPSSAVVSIDPKTGYIKAMASSSNYGDSKFNLATQAKRQPGSTFKMIVLMDALRRGVDINKTSYVSKYLNFIDPATKAHIDVHVAEGHESNKPKSLFEAVVSSDNTVFQQLDLDLGPKTVTQTARDMGITSHLDSYPAEALGGLTYGVSPLEMARAYVTINDGGKRIKPISITKVVFPDGRVDTSLSRRQTKKVFTDGQTYEAIQAMKANVARGTGTRANLGFCPTAGKTGTTNDFTDAWFNGMTSNLNTVVWVGFPGTTTSMTNVPWRDGGGEMFGGNAPASIFHDFMTSAIDRKACHDWPKPQVPFVGTPFFGKYAVSGAPSSTPDGQDQTTTTPTTPGSSTAPAVPDATTPQNGKDGGGTGNGGTKYPPQAYESPPQGAPAAPKGTAPAAGATPTTP